MTSIGIFGDSFADPTHGHDIEPNFDQHGWPHLLNKQVNIYALNGSSIYYTYKNFINNNYKHDRNIVVITSPYRISIEPSSYILDQKEWMLSITSANFANLLLEKKYVTKKENIDIVTAFKYWYDHLMIHSGSYDFAVLMYEEMKRIRPDTIFIPAFNPTDLDIPIAGPGLATYMSLDFNGWFNKTGINTYREYVENCQEQRTICHLSIETNALVAEHIKHAMSYNSWGLQRMPEKIITSQPYEYYYDTSKFLDKLLKPLD